MYSNIQMPCVYCYTEKHVPRINKKCKKLTQLYYKGKFIGEQIVDNKIIYKFQ